MAINKAMRAALKALSYPEIDIKKNYKLVRVAENMSHPPANPLFYKAWDHTVTCNDHEVPVRIFAPQNTLPIPKILLFFHGGGWVSGNIDSYERTCHAMANQTGRIVVSVDYRLAPEYPFPAGLEDCYAVAKEVFLDDTLLGTCADEIALIGDSAGGNLAAAVSLLARDRGEFSPCRQILIYPATYNDHTENSPFESVRSNGTDYLLTSRRVSDYMQLYASMPEDFKNPYFAPLLCKDLSHQPKTLVLSAEYCPLRDEGEAYGQRLRDAGNEVRIVRVKDALHGYFMLPPRFAQVKRSYELINDFLAGGCDA